MVTSLGDTPAAATAAVLGAISRPRPIDEVSVVDLEAHQGAPATGYPVEEVAAFTGPGRLAMLTQLGLMRLGAAVPPDARTSLVLCLPSFRVLDAAERAAQAEAEEPIEPAPFLLSAWAQERCREPVLAAVRRALPRAPEHVVLLFEDSPGLVSAVMAAQARLARHGDDLVIVGGVDSLVDGPVLQALQEVGLLKSPERATGAAPGEAAAFLVLEQPEAARRRQAGVLAYLHELAADREPAPEQGAPPMGSALARVVATCAAQAGPEGVLVLADLNGTTDRAHDWGCAQVRMANPARSAQAWIPAAQLGDVGAAFGPLAICLYAAGVARGASQSSSAVVWLWGAGGERAAVRLGAPPAPRRG